MVVRCRSSEETDDFAFGECQQNFLLWGFNCNLQKPPITNAIVNLRLGFDFIINVKCAIVNTAKMSPAAIAAGTEGT